MRVNVYRRLRDAPTTLRVELLRAIAREAINALPIERAAADFAAERVAGFDTETRPAFRVRALAGGARRPGAVAQGEGIEQSGSAKRARA
jgi:hypothetical protein